MCAFAVSWWGNRCVLEKTVKLDGEEGFTCRTSKIMEVKKLRNRVETEKCVRRCGLDRNTLGISSDSLLDTRFTQNLCSSRCYNHCPNIVHLFTNLAAAEGLSLPKLCNAEGGNMRSREMSNIRSSGIVASGPIQSASISIAPAVAQEPLQFNSMSFAPAPNGV
ncbi:uncharacterized protein LOC101212311 [Cucumis sativus]|uniref:PAR1 protein n=1 Tax=Cucumis sativus TaxID=3659 RepID=A0A0A0L6J6_CUCSA|nr:uncharacterized protein LOC101212311 [Cucumis sativus]KGN57378.1 hypothetical protein Csa_010219 [Cucumis sativus]